MTQWEWRLGHNRGKTRKDRDKKGWWSVWTDVTFVWSSDKPRAVDDRRRRRKVVKERRKERKEDCAREKRRKERRLSDEWATHTPWQWCYSSPALHPCLSHGPCGPWAADARYVRQKCDELKQQRSHFVFISFLCSPKPWATITHKHTFHPTEQFVLILPPNFDLTPSQA